MQSQVEQVIGFDIADMSDAPLCDIDLKTSTACKVGEYVFLQCKRDGGLVLKIMSDGSIVYGPAYTADEASKIAAGMLARAIAEALKAEQPEAQELAENTVFAQANIE